MLNRHLLDYLQCCKILLIAFTMFTSMCKHLTFLSICCIMYFYLYFCKLMQLDGSM